MKIPAALLVVSLLANVAALGVFLFGGSRPRAGSQSPPADARIGGSGTVESHPAANPALAKSVLVALFDETDPVMLRDRLRAAGVPERDIVAFIEVRLMSKYRARMSELIRRAADDPAYWRKRPGLFSGRTSSEFREAEALALAAREELKRLFGPDAALVSDPRGLRYGFLPPALRERVSRIEGDYDELRAQVMEETQGFVTAADRDRLRLLDAERKKDLEAALSPAELATYELRASRSADAVRDRFWGVNLSEDEYQRLVALQRRFDAENGDNDVGRHDVESTRKRAEAEKKLLQDFKTALGEQRYADWQQAALPERQMLQAAARRYNLSAEIVQATLQVGPTVIAQAEAIANNPDFTTEQKRQALQSLGQQTRTDLTRLLGTEAATSYLQNGALPWLRNFEHGIGVALRNGRLVNRVLEDNPAPSPKPAPPKG